MKQKYSNNRRLVLSAGFASVILALAACGGTAAPEAAGVKKTVEVQGAIPEPANPSSVKEYTTLEGIKAFEPASSLVPKDLRDKGVLVLGVDPSGGAPTSFSGSDGATFVGLDADIARALGRVLDIQIAFKGSTFDALIPGLQAKRFDAVIADMGVTVDRLKVIDMVGYARGGHGIATKPGNPLNIGENSMCGRKVAVTLASTQAVIKGPAYSADCVTRGAAPINLITVPNQQEALLQVKSGQVDAGFMDGPAVAWAAEENPKDIHLAATITGSILSMGLPHDGELTPAFVQAIKHLATLPEYSEIAKKWGMEYAELDPELLDSYQTPPTPPAPRPAS